MWKKLIAWPVLLFFMCCFLIPQKVMAVDNQEIEALKAQVKQLMQRIGELEKRQAQKVSKTKVYWKNGFRIEHKDGKGHEYKFRFRTGIQLRYTYAFTDDSIRYNGSPTGDNHDTTENYSSFDMRRLRFFVDGTAPNRDWKYYVHVQLEPKSANVHDAFIQWQRFKTFRVEFGRMKIPAFGMEYWQSGFMQNGTDRTIFTGDSEYDQDIFGNRTYDFPGSNARLRVSKHRLKNLFPAGGFLLYRSQGINANGYIDMFGKKQFLCYWLGVYNGRDTKQFSNLDSDMLYSLRVGLNLLPGSDPKGPMGPNTFKNYFMQGDYGYNMRPALALIFSTFYDREKTETYYDYQNDADKGFMTSGTAWHDTDNFGASATLLFRYMGFSFDTEYAWEQFEQSKTSYDESHFNRWAARLNMGYFLVPKRLEAVFKYAYVRRLAGNNVLKSLRSGLGLVKTTDGYAIEDNLQQFVWGLNYYLHGFNQYITFDVSWLHRGLESGVAEAQGLGLDATKFAAHPDDQNDVRLRVMYQFLF